MIELKHVEKSFPDVTPIKDVSVTINEGDIISVIGPSGTGKSVLLRCINLLGKPTKGQIFVDGEEITAKGYDVTKVRKKIGMVFQNFNLFSHLTVIENIINPQMKLLGKSKKEAYNTAMFLLSKVGMAEAYAKYPDELSGGQKQRVAICRTLAMDPEIILFDEPTSALDPTMVEEVQSVIKGLADEGKTMMIVTHDMKFARSISNRVFYMDEGGIYEDGTPDQIFDHPQKELTRIFINRLSTLDMLVTPECHNLDLEIGKIHAFCAGKGISAQRVMNACGAYEETINIVYKYYEPGDKTIHFIFEYNANSDELRCSVVPYSERGDTFIKTKINKSLETVLITHYISGYNEEHTPEGAGIRTIYTV